MAEINVYKLHIELISAGIETCGCDSNGTIWDYENNEIQDRDDVQLIIKSHDPSPDPDTVLRDEYIKAGINSDDMIFALWKKVMSSDTVDADSLQVLIDQVNLSVTP